MLPRFFVPIAGAITVIVCLVWQVLGLWDIQQGKFIDDKKLKIRSVAAKQSGMGLEQIAGLHLFGDVAAKVAAPPPPTELPKTDLKLTLIGAITDSNAQKASALIEADRQAKRYFVGDSIPGGATLHEVLPGSVVLKRENRYETLEFPKGGDAAVQTRGALAAMGFSQPVSNPVPQQVQQRPAVPPPQAGVQKPAAAPQGLTLHDRLQRAPRFNQNAPAQQ
jgi:type II secretory pathway component PulC